MFDGIAHTALEGSGVPLPPPNQKAQSMRTLEVVSADSIPLDAALHPPKTSESKGTIIQAHGITVDKDEGGMFMRLAEALSDKGFTVIRFSYRGHGKSGGTPLGVTVAGEMVDLQSVIEHALDTHPAPISIVAASFGAVSSSLLLPWVGDRIDSLVLWNPVLDLRHTFLDPELPWGLENFSHEQQQELSDRGRLFIDGEFPVSHIMWREFSLYDPLRSYSASSVPSLVIHGDRDTYVSYDIAYSTASARANTDFHTVQGSDHGFDSAEREDEAIRISADWLDARARRAR